MNPLSTSIAKSVAMGTSKWSSVDDIVSNVAVSYMVIYFFSVLGKKTSRPLSATLSLVSLLLRTTLTSLSSPSQRFCPLKKIPCYSQDSFWRAFRGSAFVDGKAGFLCFDENWRERAGKDDTTKRS